ncbi:Methionyl-tRNA formyltransferase [subsurface metagenome]
MRLFIITMDDPVQTKAFIKHIIDHRQKSIVGLAVTKGNRLTIGKKKSKITYIFSLLLIMGLPAFFKNSCITLTYKMKKKLSQVGITKNPSITEYAKSKGIHIFSIKTLNSSSFREKLKNLNIDIIINQSQNIIRKELLEIPKIGIINRHNALLPKNRGRLSPFWVLYNQDKATGVSIHFVEEDIDSGDIIVQKKYKVSAKDNFNTLVKKNYEIAPSAMLEALDKLERSDTDFLPNDDVSATYNSTPQFKHAWLYRKRRILNFIKLVN